MAYFIDNPPEVGEVIANVVIRDGKYEDLYLTIKHGARKKAEYVIHSDSRFTVQDVKKAIDSRNSYDDIMINEYSERNYLFITIGENNSMQVTGKRI